MQPLVFLLLFLIGLTLPAAAAGTRPGTLAITPVVGLYSLDRELRESILPVTGLHLGYNRSLRSGEELVFAQIGSEGRSDSGIARANIHHFRIDTLYRFTPEERLVPFIAAGFGVTNRTSPSSLERRSSVMVNYGVGLNYHLTEDFALRGDLRHLLGSRDGGRSNLEGTIGISFFMGGRQERVIPRTALAQPSSGPPEWIVVAEPDGVGIKKEFKEDKKTARALPESTPVTISENAPPPFPVVQDKTPPLVEKLKITLHVHFDTDKVEIKGRYHEDLNKIGDYLLKNSELLAIIEGHTDDVGSPAYNLKLSGRRAEEIKAYLVTKLAVPSERLMTVGYGLTRPVAENDSDAGRAQNRRAVIIFLE